MSHRPNAFARKHDAQEVKEYLELMLEEHQDDPKHRNKLSIPGAGPGGTLGVGMGGFETEASAIRRAKIVDRLKKHWSMYLNNKGKLQSGKWVGNRPESASDFTEAYDAFRDLVWYFRSLDGRSRDWY